MVNDFDISRATGRCASCGRELAEGESFYTVLTETPSGFDRRDIAEECWQAPPDGSFCHFKSRQPARGQRRKLFVDDQVLIDFFLRLGDADDERKRRFRFVLGLILLRKRLLKYEQSAGRDGLEIWRMRLVRDKSLHDLVNPGLDDAQIGELTAELSTILAGQVDAAADSDDSPVADASASH